MPLVRVSNGGSPDYIYDTLHSGSSTASAGYTVTMSKDYDYLYVSLGGNSYSATVTYTGSGQVVVNNISGSGGSSYSSYKTNVYVYKDVKQGDTLYVKSNGGVGTMGSVVLGAHKG